MAIYTRTGDAGSTALFTGQRVSKHHPRVDAYGTLDELNAILSLCACAVRRQENREQIAAVQQQLFWLSAELASESDEPAPGRRYIGSEDIQGLEQTIDRCMSAVPTVKGFVLPGRCEAASRLHIARTVARRAERRMVELAEQVALRQVVMQYINRLSDGLYALARDEDNLADMDTLTQTIIQRYLAAASSATAMAPAPLKTPPVIADTGTLTFPIIHPMVAAAIKTAGEMGIPVVMSLVDNHGALLLTWRMPDALLVSSDLAPKKAWTAAAMKRPTHLISQNVQPGQALYGLESSMDGKVVTFGGGFPLWRNGRLLGAIGVSGGSVEQDMYIAQAAMSAAGFEI